MLPVLSLNNDIKDFNCSSFKTFFTEKKYEIVLNRDVHIDRIMHPGTLILK